MIKPLVIETILIDLYHNGVYQFTISQFTHLDIRKQIVRDKLEGYSIKMNPQFYHLFTKEDEIEDMMITISTDGEVSDWFPEYYINEEYNSVSVFSENLSAVLKIRNAQEEKNEK